MYCQLTNIGCHDTHFFSSLQPHFQVLLGVLGEAKLVGHVHLLPACKLGAGAPQSFHSKLDLLFLAG